MEKTELSDSRLVLIKLAIQKDKTNFIKEYLWESKSVCLKSFQFSEEFIEGYDAFFEFRDNILRLYSNYCYVSVPQPNESGPFLYYINNELYNNEILIGETIIHFHLEENDNESQHGDNLRNGAISEVGKLAGFGNVSNVDKIEEKYYTFSMFAKKAQNKCKFEAQAKCKSYKNEISTFKLCRSSEFLSIFKDELISQQHCFCGYNHNIKRFFLIDYGREGKGSSNKTFVKIKGNKFYEITKNTQIVMIGEFNNIPKIATIDIIFS